ncbi:acid sphingomyelinase-like phosphodiesterase 3b [Haemaphysalis longicornis]
MNLEPRRPERDTGYFWHVTDFHLDYNYPERGSHRDNGTVRDGLGPYGDISRDSPRLLVESTVEAMKRIEPAVDFVLWTGDNLGLVKNATWADLYNVTRWIGDLLWRVGQRNGTVLVPTLGNHDWVPQNALNVKDAIFYRDFLTQAGLNRFLPEDAWTTFQRGGYYSRQLSGKIRLISLNTAVWYTYNKGERLWPNDQQMTWLRGQLQDAQHRGQKVFISGHVGPGYFSRSSLGGQPSVVLYGDVNDGYQDLISEYKDVVAGQFFGHQHCNCFVILSNRTGTPVSAIQLAASVTPIGKRHPDRQSFVEANNPCVRLYSYRRSTGELLDYSVYYLDLVKANKAALSGQKPQWELLFSASRHLGVSDLTTPSMVELGYRTAGSEDLLLRYINLSTALKYLGPCDSGCRQAYLCAILASRKPFHETCLGRGRDSRLPGIHHRAIIRTGMGPRDVVVGVSVSLFIVAGIIHLARVKRAGMMRGPRYQRFL